ncbi:MAG: methyltransferase domain-containing protein [Proteobacteria bacterium]|nr:methyltransferase domain-containing protein [Pseudomonadota bacterium]
MAESVAEVPALRDLWDANKNEESATDVLAKSYRTAWWTCPSGHSFQRKPRMMIRDPSCPTCALGGTSIAETHPALVKLWHPTQNNGAPSDVSASSTASRWWVCEGGHAFERSPIQMVSDSSCPHCALAAGSLAARFPEIAAEWHPHRNGDVKSEQVEPDHKMTAWWLCSKGHEFQATVRSRTHSHGRCPRCYGAWTLDGIRSFVQSLLGHIDVLTPSEMFALAMQAGALRGAASTAFVKALTTGRFPSKELEKFAEGKPSLVDDFAGDRELTLELVEAKTEREVELPPDDPFALPAAPDSDYQPDDGEIDVSSTIVPPAQEMAEGADLPVVQTREALAALDNPFIANADAETVKFLLDSAKAKLWRHAYQDPQAAELQAREFEGDAYSTIVRDRFLAEFDTAQSMELPQGYAFRPTPEREVCEPHLMQRHVAASVADKRRYGNWSGMGAGKTLSAILSTRLTNSDLTVICCPNAVVSNWAREIDNAFPGCRVQTKTWTPEWPDAMSTKPRYLVMNFEQFQQPDSEAKLVDFLARHIVDFVVVDEIHFTKQRDEKQMSQRKRLVQGLILESGKRNADLCVLGMSGTPVINTLQEGRSLVEMITGHRHDELETKATVQNCMRLYQRLVTLGTRWKPNYSTQLEETKPEIDCIDHLEEIRLVGRGTVLDMEKVLTKVRIPTIVKHLKPGTKTLIYTHYVDGISDQLWDAVKEAGLRPGLFTGKSDDSALAEFKKPNGQVDVLIASSRVSTGVDGLQYVCNKLIINSLPWTNAEYEQLRARVWRQGSKFEKVQVVIPVTFAYVNGERWSYCESKLHRLEYKKSIADAAVDGVVPEGNLRTPAQAQQDIMGWLERLETGAIETIERGLIKIPLSREPGEVKRRTQRYGDFSRMNNRWYAAASDKTHTRLEANPEEWAHYHTMYQELREKWEVVPFEEEIRWLEKREGLNVADFGCGEALIAAAVGDKHEVASFDHVAINEKVHACDIASVPLDDESVDLAIFCLSLMGANFTDYIREAHRVLRLDGQLHIWEPASYFDDPEAFEADLRRLGFQVLDPRQEGLFLKIYAFKDASKPAPDVTLRFRGHKTGGTS